MYKLNGKTLRIGRGFTHAEVQYPANWLQLSTEEDRTAIGITWEEDPVRADDRYYWNGDVNNPKALDDVNAVDEDNNQLYEPDGTTPLITRGLKYNMIAQVKDTAGKLLSQTDWYVTRKVERNVDIPTDVASKRTAIVAEAARLETAIAGVDSVEALIEVMNSQDWGE